MQAVSPDVEAGISRFGGNLACAAAIARASLPLLPQLDFDLTDFSQCTRRQCLKFRLSAIAGARGSESTGGIGKFDEFFSPLRMSLAHGFCGENSPLERSGRLEVLRGADIRGLAGYFSEFIDGAEHLLKEFFRPTFICKYPLPYVARYIR